MEFYLYLCGPITGLSYKGCVDWRIYVASKLPSHIIPISPMRFKKYLSGEKKIAGDYRHIPLSSGKGITCRDRMDVGRSHAVLANFLGAQKVSTGSIIEIGWADAFRKPIIICMEMDNPHNHPIVEQLAGFILPTLDEAIDIAIKVLTPGI